MGATLDQWRPTVRNVAEIIPDRTGAPADHDGTFDATTVPTDDQVEGLIRQIQSEVSAVVGEVPLSLVEVPVGGTVGDTLPGHVVALGSAYMAELSFFPDQQLGGRSRAEMLREDYLRALKSLAGAVTADDSGTDPGDTLRPTATFPVAAPIQWAEL